MPATESTFENSKFLSIKAGKIRSKTDKGTAGAVLREYTNPKTGEKGEVWETVYPGWRGIVRDITFYEGDGFETLNVVFDDVTLSMNASSRYASDFLKKYASADRHSEITITPFDFVTDDGKKRTGLTIVQDEAKLPDYFSAKTEKGEWEQKDGYPAYDGTTKEDWAIYLLQVKKFLKNWYLLHPINTIGDEEKAPEVETSDVDISKVPF